MRIFALLFLCQIAFGAWVYHKDHPIYSTGFKRSDLSRSHLTYESLEDLDIPIPAEYDLRPKLSPIENQKTCGSCWSFSLTATLRDALSLFNKDPGRLSQQYLVDCATEMLGCRGGDFEAANLFISPKGAPSWESYPYTARDGSCRTSKALGSILEWHYVGVEGRRPSKEDIQKAILEYGPVSVDVSADNRMMGYGGGLFNACNSGRSINHMTNLVGWSESGGYWIMRNSWGTDWGEKGWMKIKYGCSGIASDAVFMKVIKIPKEPQVFMVESQTLILKVTLAPEVTYTVEDTKKILQPFLEGLDRR